MESMRIALHKTAALALSAIFGVALAGCGENVTSPDLFVLTRTGQGKPLTLLVNDSGTIRCDGGQAKPISDALLIQARDLATNLDTDAKAALHVPATADGVFFFTIRLQDGTISFGDTAAAKHKELAPAELFAVQAAQGPCGLHG
jgi:hypothetical protein